MRILKVGVTDSLEKDFEKLEECTGLNEEKLLFLAISLLIAHVAVKSQNGVMYIYDSTGKRIKEFSLPGKLTEPFLPITPDLNTEKQS